MRLIELAGAAAVGAAILGLASCGTDAPVAGAQAVGVGGPRECFRTASVTGFVPAGRDKVNVTVGAREVFQLILAPGCSADLDWEQKIGIEARGASRICTGLDAELIVNSPSGRPERCPVRTVRRLTAAEIAAPPARKTP